MIEKIGKLLAKAEAAATEAEAEAYYEKAQSLAAAHSISLAVARAKVADSQRREEPTHRRIRVGEKGKHVDKNLIWLFSAIADSNDVEIDIAHNSTYVVAYGMPSDIDMVERLWSSLAVTMVRLADDYIKRGEWRGEKVYRSKRVRVSNGWYGPATEEVWDYYPLTAQGARASWHEGFTARIKERLRESRAAAVADAVKAEPRSGIGTDLVLKGKEVEVKDYYRRASNARGSWRGGGRSNGNSASARSAGRRAASSAKISGSAGIGGGRKAVGA
jgi:hypothetical protein